MNKEEACQYFDSRIPNVDVLRKGFPEISDLLEGEFAEGHHFYQRPSGIVVSRDLLQGKQKNPTIGLIHQIKGGPFNFNLNSGYTELMTVLEGLLKTCIVGDDLVLENEVSSVLGKFGTILAPFGTTLVLQPETENILYLCQYKLVKK